MRPKTIFILIALFILIVIAAQPLGAICIDVGNFFVSVGNNLQNMKVGH